MADLEADGEEALTRRQALVDVDKLDEALRCHEYDDAADAVVRLSQHVGELQEAQDDS